MGKSKIGRPRSISSISKFEQAQSPNLSTARAAEPFPKLRKVRSATFSGVRRADLSDYVEVERGFAQTFCR